MKLLPLLCVLLGITALAAPAGAESWSVVCEEHFPPYNFIQDGKPTGLDTEIVQAVFARMGVDETLSTQPWNRALGQLDNGGADLLYQMVGTPERAAQYLLVGPLRAGRTVLMARADSTITWNNLADLTPYAIGVVRGFRYTSEFDAAPLNRVIGNDNASLLRMLAAQRIDLVAGDFNSLWWVAREEKLNQQFKVIGAPLGEIPRYVALPKDRADKAERFRQALEAIRADGTLAAIQKRWE